MRKWFISCVHLVSLLICFSVKVAHARLNKQGHRPLGRTQSAPLPLGHPMLTGSGLPVVPQHANYDEYLLQEKQQSFQHNLLKQVCIFLCFSSYFPTSAVLQWKCCLFSKFVRQFSLEQTVEGCLQAVAEDNWMRLTRMQRLSTWQRGEVKNMKCQNSNENSYSSREILEWDTHCRLVKVWIILFLSWIHIFPDLKCSSMRRS